MKSYEKQFGKKNLMKSYEKQFGKKSYEIL